MNSPSQQPGSMSPDMNGPMQRPGDMSTQTTPSKVDDKKFVKEAAMGGMTEVEIGRLATQKGTSENVKQFGQKLVDDHTQANNDLKQAASKSGIEVPATLDSKHQGMVDKMAKLDGQEFDKAFVKHMKKDHEKDVKLFQSESQGGTDPQVKEFATKTLPVLEQHLDTLKSLKPGASGSATASK